MAQRSNFLGFQRLLWIVDPRRCPTLHFSGYRFGPQVASVSSLEMPVCKLSKRAIDALPCPADRDMIWWDDDLKGFGLKITPAGRRTFLVQYRPAADRRNPRKYTIGEYGSVTPYQAR